LGLKIGDFERIEGEIKGLEEHFDPGTGGHTP
jgi:hypothetical protein